MRISFTTVVFNLFWYIETVLLHHYKTEILAVYYTDYSA